MYSNMSVKALIGVDTTFFRCLLLPGKQDSCRGGGAVQGGGEKGTERMRKGGSKEGERKIMESEMCSWP